MRIKQMIRKIIFVLALAVFLFSAGKLIQIGWNYYTADKEYQKLQEYAKSEAKETGEGKSGLAAEAEEATEATGGLTIDFAGLQRKNPDCIGWLEIPGPDISYPIMQGADNDYYLTHTFSGEERTAASIFIDCANQTDFADENTFIYGHNMKNKSMFGRLNDYNEKSFYEKYPDIFVYTPAKTFHYKIFSCYPAEIAAQSDAFTLSFGTKEEYAAYQEQVKGYSLYDTGVDTDADHNMITLMTCNKRGYDYRFLVHAICIEEQGM